MQFRSLLPALFLGTIALLAFGSAAAGDVPPEVAERLDAAGMLGQSETFVGNFTLTTDTVVQKLNGKRRREATIVVSVTRSPDGTVDRWLVQMVKEGEDVTEKRRKKTEKKSRKLEKILAEDDDDDLMEPWGEAADMYSFGVPKTDGNAVLLSFEPKPEHRDEEGMARGTISWHRETLDPLWMEMDAVTAPRPMKELSLRMEFAREGDSIYVDQLVTEGVVKLLLRARQFEIKLRTSEVKPASPEPAAGR